MWFKELIGKKIEAIYIHPSNEELILQFYGDDKSWYSKYPLDESKFLTVFAPQNILGKELESIGKHFDIPSQTTIYYLHSGECICNIHVDGIGKEVSDEDIIFPVMDIEQQYVPISSSWDLTGAVEEAV